MTISFVILTWNSRKYVHACIHSYAKSVVAAGFDAEFLVVDNGSLDGTAKEIDERVFPDLPAGCTGRLFRLEKNRGTTISRNIALRAARGEIVAICDSDTEYLAGSWVEVAEYLWKNNDVGIVAPSLWLPEGAIQESVKRFPTIGDKLARLPDVFFGKTMQRSDRYKDFPWSTTREVDTAISACWLMRKDIFRSVGLLDEKIFYAPEDVDYCLRIWKRGKSVVFYPDFRVLHHTQQVSRKKVLSRHALSHMAGLGYYFGKHGYALSRRRLHFT